MSYLKYFLPIITALGLSCLGCNGNNIQATRQEELPAIAPFHISSPAFRNGDTVPMPYTCEGSNISPPLHWNSPFKNTASFALIMDDPDVPEITWVHWIVYNIPADDTMLTQHFPMDSTLANGIEQGFTSFRTTGYGGPCPPEGVHRYFFKLYALDTKLNVPARLTKAQLLNIMKGHILAETDLMGRYTRKKSEQ